MKRRDLSEPAENHSTMSAIVKHLTFPLYQRLKGSRVLPHLRELMKTQFLPPEELRELRLRKLRRILEHANQNTAYYRRVFDEAGFNPANVRDFADLEKLPILTKSDIIRNLDGMRATNLSPDEMHRSATGGSTGERTPFFRDNRCLSFKKAVEFRFNRWAGWDVGQRIAYVWPAIQDLAGGSTLRGRMRNALVDRSLMLYSGKLDDEILTSHTQALNAFSPTLIRAFTNPLYVLAKFLKARKNIAAFRPRAVIATGEPLLPSQRALFEEVFECAVFNLYATRENGHVASECDAHSGLHIATESLHIEFVRNGRGVPVGQPGRVLITDFENFGMPFIRYQIEDVGVPLDRTCVCGRTLPLMAFEAGRISDFLVSPRDGSLVSGSSLCHYLIAEGPDVGQVQIVQDARDHLLIRLRRSDRSQEQNAEQIERFQAIIARIFDGGMRTSIDFVDSIPHEKSGKYRFCINRISSESWS
jgi:phenylacetate-CoA ligase